uniref:Uncharacterized protein n=1 Tax=Globodera rostochiensis TaxID=31243 RepID=A0A914HDB0_GLORO
MLLLLASASTFIWPLSAQFICNPVLPPQQLIIQLSAYTPPFPPAVAPPLPPAMPFIQEPFGPPLPPAMPFFQEPFFPPPVAPPFPPPPPLLVPPPNFYSPIPMPGFTCTIIGLKKRLRRRDNAHTPAQPYFEEFRDEYNGFMISYIPDGGSLKVKGKDSRKSAASEGEGAIVNGSTAGGRGDGGGRPRAQSGHCNGQIHAMDIGKEENVQQMRKERKNSQQTNKQTATINEITIN